MDAYVVYNAEGESGPLVNSDVNGCGAVNNASVCCGTLGPRPAWPSLPARGPRIDLLKVPERYTAALLGLAARLIDQPPERPVSPE